MSVRYGQRLIKALMAFNCSYGDSLRNFSRNDFHVPTPGKTRSSTKAGWARFFSKTAVHFGMFPILLRNSKVPNSRTPLPPASGPEVGAGTGSAGGAGEETGPLGEAVSRFRRESREPTDCGGTSSSATAHVSAYSKTQAIAKISQRTAKGRHSLASITSPAKRSAVP